MAPKEISIPVQVNIDKPMMEALIAQAIRRQRWRFVAVALIGLAAGLLFAGCFFVAATGPTPTIAPVGTPTPTPSPSPSPSASIAPTPDLCLIKAVRVSFSGGSSAQLPFVAVGATERLDATPLNDSGAVPDGCNVLREPLWSVLTPITCQIVGGGYNPWLRGLRVGVCTVTATVSNVISSPFSVEIR